MKLLLLAFSTLALASASCVGIGPGASTPTHSASLHAARKLFGDGQFVETLEATDEILAADGRDRDAMLLAADAHLALLEAGGPGAQFQLPEAISRLAAATELEPTDANTWLRLADAQLKNSAFAEGIESAQRALAELRQQDASSDKLADAVLAIAANQMQIFVEARRPEIEAELRRAEPETTQLANQVLATYENARTLGAINRASLGSARVYQWMHRQADAIDVLERGILDDPEAHDLHSLLRQIYENTGGDTQAAIGAYRRMLRSHRDDPALLFYLGRAQLAHAEKRADRGQWRAAADAYANAAESFKKCGRLRRDYRENSLRNRALCVLAIGRSEFELGNLSTAATRLEEAYDICPELGEIDSAGQPKLAHARHGSYIGNQFLIGQAMADQEGLAPALAHFERLIAKHPDQYGFLYNNAALTARDLGVELDESAEGNHADNVRSAMALWERSYAYYQKAVALEPDDARTVNDCGLMLVYHLRRDYDEARAMFARAIELGRAELAELSEDAAGAVRQNLEEAIGDAYQNTGVLLEHTNRPAEEIKPWFQDAIRYYPYERREAAQKLQEMSTARNASATRRGGTTEQDPQDPRAKKFEATVREASAHADEQDFDSALLALDKVAKEMKGYAPFHRAFGNYSLEYAKAMLKQGDQKVASGLLEDATRHLDRAVRLDPKHVESRLDLADAGLAYGEFAKALAAVSGLVGEASETDRARTLRARAAARVYVNAKTKNQSASSKDLAAALDSARQDFARLERDRSLTADERTLWIHTERWAGASKNAIQIVTRAIAAADPTDGSAQNALLNQLVTLSFEIDETAAAVEALQTRRDALGTWYAGRAHYHHGLWHRRGSATDKAIRAFDAAISAFESSKTKNPDYADDAIQWIALCLGMRGLSEFGAGQVADARKTLTDAVELSPASLTSNLGEDKTIKLGLIYVGDSYFQAGELGDLADFYVEVGDLAPSDVDIANNEGLFCRDHGVAMTRSGKSKDAEKYFEASYAAYTRAQNGDPTNVQLRNDRALLLIYHLKRELGTAKQLLESAIRDGEGQLEDNPPENADDLQNLQVAIGDAWENLGVYWRDFGEDKEQAKTAFKQSLTYYPFKSRAGTRHLRRLERDNK